MSVHNIDKINLIKMAYTQITEPKRLDVTRREFHQLIKYSEAILQKLPINLVVVDNHNRIKMINEWARCFFCLGDAVVFNLPLRRLFSQANRKFLALVQQALRCEEEKDFFDVSLHIGGTRRRSHITIKPILDDSFRIGAMIVIEDITEQEQVREQMILSEKLASIGLLSAGVAHEINNPLETIHNFTEYLKFRIRNPEDRKVLSHVDEELNDIAQIVGNLISFSEAGLTGGEVFDLNGLIDQIIGLVRFNARSRKLRLSFRRQRGSLLLKAAPSEIKQVILNLLKNSFDAMPDGGDILISTGLARGDNCRSATITFRDSGRGIQGVNINDIFLPFYSTKSSPNHMGLGLSVSYGIVRKYGGEITAKNLRGKGCQFRISLPVLGNRGKEDQSTAAGAS